MKLLPIKNGERVTKLHKEVNYEVYYKRDEKDDSKYYTIGYAITPGEARELEVPNPSTLAKPECDGSVLVTKVPSMFIFSYDLKGNKKMVLYKADPTELWIGACKEVKKLAGGTKCPDYVGFSGYKGEQQCTFCTKYDCCTHTGTEYRYFQRGGMFGEYH